MAPMRKPPKQPAPEFANTLSLERAARELGVSPSELRRRLGAGEFPFVEIRGRIRVPKAALAAGSPDEGKRVEPPHRD